MSRTYRRTVDVVAADAANAVERAAAALLAGEAIVIPTETVQGLAALPTMPAAVDRLFALKDRPPDVALAVLVDSVEQAEAIAAFSAAARRVAGAFWPGPLTLVLPRRDGVELFLGGDGATVGVRCPDHTFARALAARVGPIAATSANRHGEATPTEAVAAATALAGPVVLVVDGGPCAGSPSTVVDLTAAEPRIVRAGPISEREILAVWN